MWLTRSAQSAEGIAELYKAVDYSKNAIEQGGVGGRLVDILVQQGREDEARQLDARLQKGGAYGGRFH
ncbi:MAG: hypothetical protein AAB426_03975 [Myxococcota bacterium]